MHILSNHSSIHSFFFCFFWWESWWLHPGKVSPDFSIPSNRLLLGIPRCSHTKFEINFLHHILSLTLGLQPILDIALAEANPFTESKPSNLAETLPSWPLVRIRTWIDCNTALTNNIYQTFLSLVNMILSGKSTCVLSSLSLHCTFFF